MQLLLELQNASYYFFHICSSTPPQDPIYYVELVELPFNSATACYALFMSYGMDGKDGKYSISQFNCVLIIKMVHSYIFVLLVLRGLKYCAVTIQLYIH